MPFAICLSKMPLYNSFNRLKPVDLSCFLTSSIVFLTPDAKYSLASSPISDAIEPLNEGLLFKEELFCTFPVNEGLLLF